MSTAAWLEPLVVDLIRREAVTVPPYPAVAMKLRRLVDSGRFGLADLVKLASADQALAATLLRHANSAQYRGLSPIASLHEAVGRLGAAEVRRVALAVGLAVHAEAHGPLAELRRDAWRRALMSALCCQHLAESRGMKADEAFVCGLLHDFGRVVALACFEEILAHHQPRGPALPAAAWSELADRFHVELGVVTAARWNLPELLAAVISSHHQPQLAGKFRSFVDLVMVADAVVEAADTRAFVAATDLAAIGGLAAGERGLVLQIVSQLPGFVAAFGEISPPTSEMAAFPSRVQKPATALEGEQRPASLEILVQRSGGTVPFRATHLTRTGLSFVGPTKLKENTVVRLHLRGGAIAEGTELEVWAHVLLCQPEGAEHRIEAKLFAIDLPTQGIWDGLYVGAPTTF